MPYRHLFFLSCLKNFIELCHRQVLLYIIYGASIWDKNQGNSEVFLEVSSLTQVLLVPFCTLKKFCLFQLHQELNT